MRVELVVHASSYARGSASQSCCRVVGDHTLADLKQLDFGSWFQPQFKGERIATVQEVLELCKGKIDVMLDLKEGGDVYSEKIVALVRKHGDPRRTILGVRTVEHARDFRKLLPEARQIALIPEPKTLAAFADAGVEAIRLWPKWLSEPALVAEVRKRKLQLHLGTGKGRPPCRDDDRTATHLRPLLIWWAGERSMSYQFMARLLTLAKSLALYGLKRAIFNHEKGNL